MSFLTYNHTLASTHKNTPKDLGKAKKIPPASLITQAPQSIFSNTKQTNIRTYAPNSNKLIPESTAPKGMKTLVLDLDETLVHSSFEELKMADIVLPITLEDQVFKVFVMKRPGLDIFLKAVFNMYEVIVFTASMANYANPLLDIIDPTSKISHRLFREHALQVSNGYIKDISKIGRKLSDIIIIDNSPLSYSLQPQNAIPILSWFFDEKDNELHKLIPVLEMLSKEADVRNIIPKIVKNNEVSYIEYKRLVSKSRKKENIEKPATSMISNRMKSITELHSSIKGTSTPSKGTSTFTLRIPPLISTNTKAIEKKFPGIKKIDINLLDLYKRHPNVIYEKEKASERSNSLISKFNKICDSTNNVKHSFLTDKFNSTLNDKSKKGDSLLQTLPKEATFLKGDSAKKPGYISRIGERKVEHDALKDKPTLSTPNSQFGYSTFDSNPSASKILRTEQDLPSLRDKFNINSPKTNLKGEFSRARTSSSNKPNYTEEGGCINRLLEKIKQIELSIK